MIALRERSTVDWVKLGVWVGILLFDFLCWGVACLLVAQCFRTL